MTGLREHQVVVVFDVTADDVLSAGRAVVGLINGTRGRFTLPDRLIADSVIESWWMPEEPLRSQVDRNDNGPMHLEPDDIPEELFVEDDSEDQPVVWAHDGERPDAPLALLTRHDVLAALSLVAPGRREHLQHAADALWDHIVRGLPTSAPSTESGAA